METILKREEYIDDSASRISPALLRVASPQPRCTKLDSYCPRKLEAVAMGIFFRPFSRCVWGCWRAWDHVAGVDSHVGGLECKRGNMHEQC